MADPTFTVSKVEDTDGDTSTDSNNVSPKYDGCNDDIIDNSIDINIKSNNKLLNSPGSESIFTGKLKQIITDYGKKHDINEKANMGKQTNKTLTFGDLSIDENSVKEELNELDEVNVGMFGEQGNSRESEAIFARINTDRKPILHVHENNQPQNETTRITRVRRVECKELRNSGKSYTTAKGKVVREREQKFLNSCRLQCAFRFTEAEKKYCFEYYWKLGNRDKRAMFVANSIKILPKKTKKSDDSVKKNRDCYCVYKLMTATEEKPICKECYCRVLGETKGFVNVVIERKKKSPLGIMALDKRGRHPRKNKRIPEKKTLA